MRILGTCGVWGHMGYRSNLKRKEIEGGLFLEEELLQHSGELHGGNTRRNEVRSQ